MPWVTGWSFISNDHADRAAGANVVNVVLWIIRIRYVALLGVKQQWVVVVTAERRIVDSPDKMTSGIDFEVDFHVNRRSGSGYTHRLRWSNAGKGIVCTGISAIDMAGRFGNSSVIRLFIVDHREAIRLVSRLSTLTGG